MKQKLAELRQSYEIRNWETCSKQRFEANLQRLSCWKKTDNVTWNIHGALTDNARLGKVRKKKRPWVVTNDTLDATKKINQSIKLCFNQEKRKHDPVVMQNYSETN